MRSLLGAAVALLVAPVWPGIACAQAFTFHPLAGSRTIEYALRDDDFIWDGSRSGPPGTLRFGRYAGNQFHAFHFVGNPNIRALDVGFFRFRMDPIVLGGTNDYVAVGWYGTSVGSSGPTTGEFPDGTYAAPALTLSASPSASIPTHSLMFPGATMTFRTGASWNGSGGYVEGEHVGWDISWLRVVGTGIVGNSTVQTLPAHRRIIGVLLGGGDTVHMRLPIVSGARFTATLWLANPDTNAVRLYARCGALPTAASYDYYQTTWDAATDPGWSAASLALPPCAAGWFLTADSTSPEDHAFNLFWGVHDTAHVLDPARVGFNFTPSATEAASFRGYFRSAAWVFHSASHGVHAIRSYSYYNNVDCVGNTSTACGGQMCNACVVATGSVPSSNPCASGRNYANQGRVYICQATSMLAFDSAAHEYAHALLGLADEYEFGSCPTHVRLCPSSFMSGTGTSSLSGFANSHGLCTAVNHRTGLDIWTGLTATATYRPNYNGPSAIDCVGGAHAFPGTDSAWNHVNLNHAIIDVPLSLSAHNIYFATSWADDPVMGYPLN